MRVISPRHRPRTSGPVRVLGTLAAVACTGVIAIASGCGSEERPPEAQTGTLPTTPVPSVPNPFGGDASLTPTCDFGPESGVCGCTELTALEDVPNLYFVLDRSGSMMDGDKWTTTRTVVATLIGKLGPRAKFGAAVFPDPRENAGSCAKGIEVMAPRAGDVGSSKTLGPTKSTFIASTNVPAFGGTPTAATLDALRPKITALPGRTFVVLATDGGPNCSDAACEADKCTLNIEQTISGCRPNQAPNCCDPSITSYRNCLDDTATLRAVKALATAGIPTYVIGFPGVGPYAPVLDALAEAGGTALPRSPKFYEVTSYDSAAFEKSLGLVAARITSSCTIALKSEPPDRDEVNVYVDDVAVPRDPANGWTLEGTQVTLVGETCERVTDGTALSVRIVAGCPTVQPR